MLLGEFMFRAWVTLGTSALLADRALDLSGRTPSVLGCSVGPPRDMSLLDPAPLSESQNIPMGPHLEPPDKPIHILGLRVLGRRPTLLITHPAPTAIEGLACGGPQPFMSNRGLLDQSGTHALATPADQLPHRSCRIVVVTSLANVSPLFASGLAYNQRYAAI